MTPLIAEQIVDIKNTTGECPIWCPSSNKIFWTDIPEGKIFSFDPDKNHLDCIYEGRKVGGFTLQKDGSFLLFRDFGNIVVFKDGRIIQTIIKYIPTMKNKRFNDVIATPKGSVIAGTFCPSPKSGYLYQIFPNGSYKTLLKHQGIPNGMAFSNNLEYMFYQDSKENTLWRFDYDQTTDSLSNMVMIINHFDTNYPGRGDGLSIDQKDRLFSGRYGGGCVLIENIKGISNLEINIPNAQNVTSCIFGGKHMEDLYITTAGGSNRSKLGVKSGSLFRVSLKKFNSKGKPEFTTNF